MSEIDGNTIIAQALKQQVILFNIKTGIKNDLRTGAIKHAPRMLLIWEVMGTKVKQDCLTISFLKMWHICKNDD